MLHLTDEETEAQKGKITHPTSPGGDELIQIPLIFSFIGRH